MGLPGVITKSTMSKGFVSLLGVSFFGAANDNILKQFLMLMVVTGGVWANCWGPGTQGWVFLVLTVPFVLLSGFAGQLADKYSKRNVILVVKLAEIPIALFALLGLALQSFWISLIALLLFAVQSSFFGPAKFGIIPTFVSSERLSLANGMINGLSNLAIILGSLVGGYLTSVYYPTMKNPIVEAAANVKAEVVEGLDKSKGEQDVAAEAPPMLVPDPSRESQRWPIGLALVGVSVVGLVVVFLMPCTPAVDPELELSLDIAGSHIETFRAANRPLLVVLFSWSGFYLIGSLALMLLPEYQSILGLQPTQITALIGLLAISIVVGSCAAGLLSGKSIRPYFSVVGALGMTAGFAIMGCAPLNYGGLASLIVMIGVFAGFYIVPLQALLQYLAPSEERGRFFGTANALSFAFMAIAALFFILLSRAGITSARIPLFCAGLAGVGTFVGIIELNRIMAAQKTVAQVENSQKKRQNVSPSQQDD